MKTTVLMTFVVLLGIALGVGAATLRIEMTPWDPKPDEGVGTTSAGTSLPSGPSPKVVVDKAEYDFGTLDLHDSGSRDFMFTNEGDAPLTLASGATSCRCATSKISQEKVPPGDSAKVTITYKPTDTPGPYQQTAKILTNDPQTPQVTLTISGRITVAMGFLPSELVFSRLTVGETSTGESRLLCYLEEPLTILGHTWSDATTAQYYELTQRPLSSEELNEEPLARSGVLMKVTVKPGMPQGSIRQRLLVETNCASSPVIALPIEGVIGSEITVVGRGWNPETGILTLGNVASREGAQRRLLLVVRGPLRKDAKFQIERVAPDVMKVRLGKSSEINEGSVVQIPLFVDIPQGSPSGNYLGSEQGKMGEIVLTTTHPDVPRLRILVRFVIEG